MHSIPKSWEDVLAANLEYIENLIFQGHHLIKKYQVYCWTNEIASKSIVF